MAEIQFPIEVKKISFGGSKHYNPKPLISRASCGDFVSVRVAEEGVNATHLGVMIGEIARGTCVKWDEKKGELIIDASYHNPAMFVPALNRVVFGMECWWRRIDSPDDLKAITDADISNVWYVQALKSFESADESSGT